MIPRRVAGRPWRRTSSAVSPAHVRATGGVLAAVLGAALVVPAGATAAAGGPDALRPAAPAGAPIRVVARSGADPRRAATPRRAVRSDGAIRRGTAAFRVRGPRATRPRRIPRATIRPWRSPSAASRGRTFVAFGDSYSSGPGLAPAREPGCGRSSVNWVSDVARAFGLGDERRGDWADYSCAGATAAPRPGGPATTLRDQIGWAARDGSLGTGTEAVTFTAGGNDGWAGREHDALYEVLSSCIRAGATCGPGRRIGPIGQLLPDQLASLLPSGLATLVSSLLATGDERDRWLSPDDLTVARTTARLRPAVAEIRRRAPGATIAVVGYPRVVPPAGSPGCTGPLGVGWSLDPGEVTYVDGLLTAYDRAQRGAVAELDRTDGPVRYVDLRTPSTGHDVCAGPTAWVNAPILTGLGFGGDSLHPSVDGMGRIAGVVTAFAYATGLARAR